MEIFQTLLSLFEEKPCQLYGAGILHFIQFCDNYNIPKNLRMPANSILISGFIAHHLHNSSQDVIKLWINGIQLWHLFNHAEWPKQVP